MRREPRNLRVAFTAAGLTHFGGMLLVQRSLHRLGLRPAFRRAIRFPQRNQRYSVSEMLIALLYPLILGLGRIEKFQSPRKK